MNLAFDILRNTLQDDQQLNSIHTTFALFHKQQIAFPTDDPSVPRRLHESFANLYSEFDRHAWWWDYDLPLKSALLGLRKDEQAKIAELHESYKRNLFQSVEQVDKLRAHFSAKDYEPDDSRNTELLNETKNALDALVVDRSAIASRLANIFMPSR